VQDPSHVAFPTECSTSVTCVVRFVEVFAPTQDPNAPVTAEMHVTATFVPTSVPDAPPVVRASDGAFLCYSRFQVDPRLWPEAEASALPAKGYWRPPAVLGSASATRLGASSLVCNPPNAVHVIDHGFVDDGGIVLAGVRDPWLGLYPLAG